ncbi:MAG TPA: glutamate 5-kinase [Candidatus Paceibacterota bacterium]|jgi:glutamate 5-kinase|nr:glutamate 5-kinase [Candidatus Paceibacterota bacterium]
MGKRIVVKVGTGVVSDDSGELDEDILKGLVDQIVHLREKGAQVVLVTSGAVGAGKSILSKRSTGSPVVQKQLYAAVGQVKLMGIYARLFAQHGYACAQVLATKEDFRDDMHYENMKNCLNALLPDGVVPIVNENDVIATAELMFTDNDELAGLVVSQLEADTLVILTSTDGILDREKKSVQEVRTDNVDEVSQYITDDTSSAGRGGMRTKFVIAAELSKRGTTVYIANGKSPNVLLDIFMGVPRGTRFVAV